METLMIPIPKAAGPEIAARPRNGRAGEESFSGHLENRLSEQRSRENILGGRPEAKQPNERERSGSVRSRGDEAAARGSKGVAEKSAAEREAELTALIGEYLGLLRDQAEEVESGPGAWQFNIDDPAQLAALAEFAGMNEADTAALLKSFEHNQGVFEMGEFLNRFARHFLALEQELPVPVPETDLPYLQLILSKLGLPAEELEQLAAQAVRGDNTLDLAAFLKGLESLDPEKLNLNQQTTLTGWDAEQLLVVLDAAGVSKALQRELLPELHAPWDQPQRPNLPLELDLDRFRQLLAKGVAEIQNARPQADIPQFLSQLKEIFSRAGFAEQRVGWSPAVQAAVEKVYGQLMESIDLATVRVEKVARPLVAVESAVAPEEQVAAAHKSAVAPEEQVAVAHKSAVAPEEQVAAAHKSAVAPEEQVAVAHKSAVAPKEPLPVEEKIAESATGKDANSSANLTGRAVSEAGVSADSEGEGGEENFSGRHFLNELREHGRGGERGEGAQGVTDPGSADNQRSEAMRALGANPRFNSQLEQQVFNRITAGVAGGLQRNEHHLVLHLYPRELGEVRVEMLVRDNQVSLSFAMENTRVKGILEKNMDMFRENLENRGFKLGECMVSVDQNSRDDSGEAWQRFASAWSNQRGAGMVRRESLAEVSESVLYHRPAGNIRENGVDLFA